MTVGTIAKALTLLSALEREKMNEVMDPKRRRRRREALMIEKMLQTRRT